MKGVADEVGARLPRATYRLQFHREFDFGAACKCLDYLHALGISDVYASPLFRAGRNSTHGYDVCSFEEINPDLGGRAGLDRMLERLKEKGMGLVLDIVPNHMRADVGNPWWSDVLLNGRRSRYATFFDIDWEAREATGKVLLPMLGDRYARVLGRGEIQLLREEGCVWAAYYDHRFPLSLESTLSLDPTREVDPETLHGVLEQQAYRLAYWKAGPDQINYRRFFEINQLVCLNMQRPAVFDAVHRLIPSLIASGVLTGLRIDHPDGLQDPKQYFARLAERFGSGAKRALQASERRLYVVAEKILSDGEALPEDWAVDGTTGYDFLNRLNNIFVATGNADAFTEVYREFTGCEFDYSRVLFASRKKLLRSSFPKQFRDLLSRLRGIALKSAAGRDFTQDQLETALIGFLSAFPVYRTYIPEDSLEGCSADRKAIRRAAKESKRLQADVDSSALAFLRATLINGEAGECEKMDAELLRRFIIDFQKLTAPLAAKGVEDTACYVYDRLLSLNEVGGDPGRFGDTVGKFHSFNRRKAVRWPHAMLSTATHDTKRGEDVRARINVLSEMPEQWEEALGRWRDWNAGKKAEVAGEVAPDANDEYFLYQTLMGAWPFERTSEPGMFRQRLSDYMVKAARESKRHTSWVEPDPLYERALISFVEQILKPSQENVFLADFKRLERRTAFFGAINSLAQVVFKLSCPGVPDIYQGNELWDLNLVDPDNRRPVDFPRRAALLSGLQGRLSDQAKLCRELLAGLPSGEVKLYVTWQGLELRKKRWQLFQAGRYIPAGAFGKCAEHLCAFVRRLDENEEVIAVAPRLAYTLCGGAERFPLGPEIWGDTVLTWPGAETGREYRDQFSGQSFKVEPVGRGAGLRVGRVLTVFPVALLQTSPAGF